MARDCLALLAHSNRWLEVLSSSARSFGWHALLLRWSSSAFSTHWVIDVAICVAVPVLHLQYQYLRALPQRHVALVAHFFHFGSWADISASAGWAACARRSDAHSRPRVLLS
ncbi:hypothetical protein B0H19DRAFT_1256434 [Mycena capillaripes]|nr:hypothetical protein B0H19DRAFT_1256434 [Mycena capillaripes]